VQIDRMARPVRIESEGGAYHVLNRGNFRTAIFRLDRTKSAFLKGLAETCCKTGWVVHAWVLMSNHYHVALSTPHANLVDGMHWLQGTFANRFNRYRNERGHVFQGRYKSWLVDPGERLGRVCHYIHLNPIRAHLCPQASLPDYPWTSLGWLCRPKSRPDWFDPTPALRHAGGLKDTPSGRKKYCEYLGWLAEDDPAQKQLKYDVMCRGWITGARDFVEAVTKEHRELATRDPHLSSPMQNHREARWQEALAAELRRIGRTKADLLSAGKSAPWKLQLALVLQRTQTVTNRWLGEQLYLGGRDYVSRRLSALDNTSP